MELDWNSNHRCEDHLQWVPKVVLRAINGAVINDKWNNTHKVASKQDFVEGIDTLMGHVSSFTRLKKVEF